MLELSSKGFPHNKFYALDLAGVPPAEVESFLTDGLRNFKSKINCRYICVRVGLAGKPEIKLFLAPELDASNNELILSKMKEALVFLSKKFNGYNNGFLILQEWTPEEDYKFSINLMLLQDYYIIEAVKGNHFNLDRGRINPTIIKFSPKGSQLIKSSLGSDDLMLLNRHLKQLFNNHFFESNCVYELSFLKNRFSFYQVKKPGKLFKHPLSKQDFYSKLSSNGIAFNSRILRKN